MGPCRSPFRRLASDEEGAGVVRYAVWPSAPWTPRLRWRSSPGVGYSIRPASISGETSSPDFGGRGHNSGPKRVGVLWNVCRLAVWPRRCCTEREAKHSPKHSRRAHAHAGITPGGGNTGLVVCKYRDSLSELRERQCGAGPGEGGWAAPDGATDVGDAARPSEGANLFAARERSREGPRGGGGGWSRKTRRPFHDARHVLESAWSGRDNAVPPGHQRRELINLDQRRNPLVIIFNS